MTIFIMTKINIVKFIKKYKTLNILRMLIISYLLFIVVILFIVYYFTNLKKKVEERDDYYAKHTKKILKAFIPYYKIL